MEISLIEKNEFERITFRKNRINTAIWMSTKMRCELESFIENNRRKIKYQTFYFKLTDDEQKHEYLLWLVRGIGDLQLKLKIYTELNSWKDWKNISKSPYGNSFYDSQRINWDYKPENSLRIADHWNFWSNGLHCVTKCGNENIGWAIGIYKNGFYEIIKVL